MGLEQEVENVTVPGQGLRRVRNLPLLSAIGFSGESVLVFELKMEFQVEIFNHTQVYKI